MEVYDVYLPLLRTLEVPPLLIMACHAVFYGILVASVALPLPVRTRLLHALACSAVLLGFLWFGRCWVLELERRMLPRRADHVVVELLLQLPRSVRYALFSSLQVSLVGGAWVRYWLVTSAPS